MTAFTARSADLAAAVLRAARVVPGHLGGLPPVCKGILLDAAPGGVEVIATDLQTTGRGRLPADVAAPGRILVDAVHLARIARHLPAPDVTVATVGPRAVVTCGPARWSLLTLPDADYPADLPGGPGLTAARPVAADAHERALAHGQAFMRSVRPRRAARAPRARELYRPAGLDVGAWITWARRTGDDEKTVTGQVWSPAPGPCAVWALAEGETAPAYVQPRYGRRGDLADLVETPPPATPHR